MRFLTILMVITHLLISVTTSWAESIDHQGERLKFGIFPNMSPDALFNTFNPIAKRLEKELGQPVQVVTAPSIHLYLERAKAAEYDFAYPCVSHYFAMQKEADYSVVARGLPSYYGVVIVHKNSDINTLGQLKGKKIAVAGKGSYGGFKFLDVRLNKIGFDTKKDVSFVFLGRLDSVIHGVARKSFDAGVTRLDTLESKPFHGISGHLKIIETSEEIPQFPFVVRKGLDKKMVDAFTKVLTAINMDNGEDKSFLNKLRMQKIVPSTNADYKDFRKVLMKTKGMMGGGMGM